MTATPGSAELLVLADRLDKSTWGIKTNTASVDLTTAAAFIRLAAKPDEDVWRSIWVAKAPNDRLDFNRVYEREPSAKIKEEHERCGWKIVELKIRETSTTGEPKR